MQRTLTRVVPKTTPVSGDPPPIDIEPVSEILKEAHRPTPKSLKTIQKLAQTEKMFRLVVPYYPRDTHKKAPENIEFNFFPPKEVDPYSFKEALELLEIFGQRYIENNTLPPTELEPWAEEVADPKAKEKVKFVLEDVFPRPTAAILADQVPFDSPNGPTDHLLFELGSGWVEPVVED